MIRKFSLFVVLVACAGCVTQGPALRNPKIVPSTGYTALPMPDKTISSSVAGGAAQSFDLGADIPAAWWTLFKCEELDQLIKMALKDSPGLAAAEAALRQAQENYNVRSGLQKYPSVNGALGVSRQKSSPAAAGMSEGKGSIFNLYNASVNVSYTFDIFGGAKRELEALAAQVDYEQFRMQGVYLALTSNVVTTVIKEAALRAQLKAIEEILQTQEKQAEMLKKQLALGGTSRTAVLAQETQIEQTKALLPPLGKEIDQTRHQLAVLVGKLPSDGAQIPEFDMQKLNLPTEVPVSLPSSLARQRPDIRAVEALLHAASAQVGAATADLYPQVTLSGAFGSMATQPGDLFKMDNMAWNIGSGLVQPIFNGGALRAKQRSAVATYDQVAAQYRQTVLVAFQNVADVLRALDADAATLKAQADAESVAAESLLLTQKQFEAGALNYMLLLDAQRQYQQVKIGLIQARAARFADTAALFQALGGGWWKEEGSND
jgi:NodT family efflux transporter outer membrane factor (OMF) lipoprotein